jgi:hypothetical protein
LVFSLLIGYEIEEVLQHGNKMWLEFKSDFLLWSAQRHLRW